MNDQEKKTKNGMINLIEKEDKGVHDTQNVLARVWRIVLVRSDIDVHKWNRLLTKWQDRVMKIHSKKGSANMKGNMSRRLAEPRLSWPLLMRGFSIYEVEKTEVIFRLHKRGEIIEIPMVISNDEMSMEDDEDNQ